MPKLRVIYEPRGPAREYADLALNPYKGCTHRCVYCYNNGRFSKPGAFFSRPQPRLNILKNIERDCDILKSKFSDNCPEIVMTFLGDCYQPAESKYKITRQIIKILIKFDLPFTVLTKSALIDRDFDLLRTCQKFRAGFSFTTIDPVEAKKWEPGISYVLYRAYSLQKFKSFGVKTWVSLEPVMSVESTIRVIEELNRFVDFFWIGALQHMSPPEPIDLVDAKNRISVALNQLNCKYEFKQSF